MDRLIREGERLDEMHKTALAAATALGAKEAGEKMDELVADFEKRVSAGVTATKEEADAEYMARVKRDFLANERMNAGFSDTPAAWQVAGVAPPAHVILPPVLKP